MPSTPNDSMLRMKSNNRTAAIQRDKRKSEVLIAAQSLDNEIRSVKNLKRLSIGSMDLLIDPELDIKFGGESNGRRSWSGATSSSTSTPNVTTSMNNTRYSDPTPLEKLHVLNSADTEPYNKSRQGNYTGHKKVVHSPSRKLNANALKNNLLWVPANQHPNVKPDNYLELVQDTLQNIRLSDNDDNDNNNNNESDEAPGETESYGNKENLNVVNVNRGMPRHGNASLIRRPSTLRRSYTEFGDSGDDIGQEDDDSMTVNKVKERTPRIRERPISLRDITEELTKISNSAGLTDDDAITLARTLNMAGSYSDKGDGSRPKDSETKYEEENDKVTGSQTETSDDVEYASNMPISSDSSWPERSSLKRSRFNTYRIRSHTEEQEEEQVLEETKNEDVSRLHLAENTLEMGINSPKSPFKQEDDESDPMSSPGSIGDFQDIYDHYTQSSGDWEKEMGIEKDKALEVGKVEDVSVEQELEPQEEPTETIVSAATEDSKETKRHRRRNGWTWLNNKMNKEEDTGESQRDDEGEEDVESQRMERDSSKKHHISMFNGSEKTEAINKEEANNSNASTSTSQTRQKIEKTFANLFRRKAHHKHEAAPLPSLPTPNNDTAHAPETKLKKLASKNGREPTEPIVLHNRPHHNRHHQGRHGSREINMKGTSNTQMQSQLQPQPQLQPQSQQPQLQPQPQPQPQLKPQPQPLQLQMKGESSGPGIANNEESDAESLPKLQPAISVSSTKSNSRDCEEADTKKKNKEKRSNTTNLSNGQHSKHAQKKTGHEQKDQTAALADPPASPAPALRHTSVLPPRKLTFADVKKSEKPNAPVQFTDSAFGFPLPLLTVSTVVMFDHRLPINVERAIYRLSHLKLSNSKRELREQVLLSNFMYAYLNLVNHTLYMEQAGHDKEQQQL
ncbi:hypothetical protein SEUBUCD646_0M04110 [Saccharomyces eubayanus]|uniref:Zillion different screens protein n=2 Tax=Saccharomyces TaxID=4930 RepID=A0A6C1EER5_SACPS|nr:zillion different screens protein [Saccharomyces pastorianus]CAI1654666.1 hypothetical protein SEUBUCD650_0M04050 [Saccharomyces eubayanus]CAI1684657.1 hypothetical protein SEUBUCD646_0M04110 [Saccharomyces eubayanus]